jgi:RNA polymerase sigma-70 factor, ECF subfamily
MAYAAANEMAVSGDTAVAPPAVMGLDDIEGVMRLYRARILRYAMFAVRDRDAAETITQECFLKAYRARESFRGDCSLSTWLMQIAVNLVRDYARSKQFQFWKRAQTSAVDVSEVTEFLKHPGSSAESGVLAREQLKAVWAAVEKLSKMQREVFLLRFVEEMELREIAELTGMKESTVKSHLYRALNSVRTRVLTETDGAQ